MQRVHVLRYAGDSERKTLISSARVDKILIGSDRRSHAPILVVLTDAEILARADSVEDSPRVVIGMKSDVPELERVRDYDGGIR